MNYKPLGAQPVFPKWVDTYCRYCGEHVPAFHNHICDDDKKTERERLRKRLRVASHGWASSKG